MIPTNKSHEGGPMPDVGGALVLGLPPKDLGGVMQPMGMARVPRAVDKARSSSPNHTVASLLELLPKNTYANAPRTFPSVAPTPKFSVVWIISSLAHAERVRRALPIDKHTLRLSHLDDQEVRGDEEDGGAEGPPRSASSRTGSL